ncbi:MAG: alanine racemase [Ruminococcus sp.]|jgi:alanine racemase
MELYRRIHARIDLDAVEKNFIQMKNNIKKDTKMIAVVKADGYGHGAVPIAKMAEEFDYIWGFAVATVGEAMQLRQNKIRKPILILGFAFPEDYETIVRNEIRPAVFKVSMAKELSQAAVKAGKDIKIHLAVDTGMNRIGFADTQESVEKIGEIARLPRVEVEGMFTHFARADEISLDPAKKQLDRYLRFDDMLKKAGINVPFRHCSNSAAIMQFPEANLDLVRAGISIYGLYPSDEVKKEPVHLTPVMSLKSSISFIKTLDKGEAVSYGGTYITERPTVVATIPVGYADGYARSLSNKGYVLIRGKKAPILGRVCMDQFMVDVTEIEGVQEFDEVTLLGRDGDEKITMEMLGDLSGRFNYEFACCIDKRVPRIFVRHGNTPENFGNTMARS